MRRVRGYIYLPVRAQCVSPLLYYIRFFSLSSTPLYPSLEKKIKLFHSQMLSIYVLFLFIVYLLHATDVIFVTSAKKSSRRSHLATFRALLFPARLLLLKRMLACSRIPFLFFLIHADQTQRDETVLYKLNWIK